MKLAQMLRWRGMRKMKVTVYEMINEIEYLSTQEERKEVKHIYRNVLKQLRDLPRDKYIDKTIILNGLNQRIKQIAGA